MAEANKALDNAVHLMKRSGRERRGGALIELRMGMAAHRGCPRALLSRCERLDPLTIHCGGWNALSKSMQDVQEGRHSNDTIRAIYRRLAGTRRDSDPCDAFA